MQSTAEIDTTSIRHYVNPSALPTWAAHIGAVVGIYVCGWSWEWFGFAVAMYYARMFFVTGVYHRYFSHRTYKTSRWFQAVLAFFGCMCVQKGAIWWASHHRVHHRVSDTETDPHSPTHTGFLWSHYGWILSPTYNAVVEEQIPDFLKFPELRWLNTYYLVPAAMYAGALYWWGGLIGFVYGFVISTVMLWHGTFTINSLAHVWGSKRFDSGDTSRNNFILALLTMGEGWHNNHHYYQSSTNQGFYWWEIDLTYYILKALAAVGLVWDLRTPPQRVLDLGRRKDSAKPAAAKGAGSEPKQPSAMPDAA